MSTPAASRRRDVSVPLDEPQGDTRPARRSRNATEGAILTAARQAIDEHGFARLTIEGIARRAFVSRTAVYFYFTNKRAVVDRLIQQAFSDMYDAATVYLEGDGDPRRELHVGLRRVVGVVNRDAPLLLLAGRLSGMEDRIPPEWAPYIERFVRGAEARIRRDQADGLAPSDIPAVLSAQALLAMVERHITFEVIKNGREASMHVRALAELWWRAVYSSPRDARNLGQEPQGAAPA
jgi:TetR/AcrR family transcriptional regulator, ethionamide resistance regulator